LRRLLSVPGTVVSGVGRWLVRHAIGLAAYPADLAGTVGRAWRSFFFTPADPTPLALIRISVGLLAVWSFLTLGLDPRSNLGSDGWADPEALRVFWKEWKHGSTAWSLWLLVPDRLLPVAWVVGLVVLVLFTLGLMSRVTAVLAWLILVSTVRRAPVLFFGFDQIVSTWMMYLAACGASGQTLSLDRLLARRRRPARTVSANLGLRLIQLHLCLIYGIAGLAKLQGAAWWNGEAVLMILLAPEYRAGDLTWLAAYPRFLNLLTHATVALEILYPVLIWVRVFRPLMLVGMVLLHLGIDQTLGLTEFSLAMIAGNLAFVSGRWLRGRYEPTGSTKVSPD
jgi:Vitamin K-dependent gamma-carboxylase